MYQAVNTVITVSDDGKTAIFITKDDNFIQYVENTHQRGFSNTVHLGTVGQFKIYSQPTSGYDFGHLVLSTQGID